MKYLLATIVFVSVATSVIQANDCVQVATKLVHLNSQLVHSASNYIRADSQFVKQIIDWNQTRSSFDNLVNSNVFVANEIKRLVDRNTNCFY